MHMSPRAQGANVSVPSTISSPSKVCVSATKDSERLPAAPHNHQGDRATCKLRATRDIPCWCLISTHPNNWDEDVEDCNQDLQMRFGVREKRGQPSKLVLVCNIDVVSDGKVVGETHNGVRQTQ